MTTDTDIVTDSTGTTGDIVTDSHTPLAAQAEQRGRTKVLEVFGEGENALKGLANDGNLSLEARTIALQSVTLFTTKARVFVNAGGNPTEILNAILSGNANPTVPDKPVLGALGGGLDSAVKEEPTAPATDPTIVQLEAIATKLGLEGGAAKLVSYIESILAPIAAEDDIDVKHQRMEDVADAARGVMVPRADLDAVKAELADERNDALPTTEAGKRAAAQRNLAKERNEDDPKSLAGKLKKANADLTTANAELNADDPDTVAGKGKKAAELADTYLGDLRSLATHIKGNQQVAAAVYGDAGIRQLLKDWYFPRTGN